MTGKEVGAMQMGFESFAMMMMLFWCPWTLKLRFDGDLEVSEIDIAISAVASEIVVVSLQLSQQQLKVQGLHRRCCLQTLGVVVLPRCTEVRL